MEFHLSVGTEHFAKMFELLYLEMAFPSALRDLVEGSGWTIALQKANIARPGVAQTLITGHETSTFITSQHHTLIF